MIKITLALFALCTLPVSAAVNYRNLGNLSVPNTIDGVYINILTGATTTSFPTDFNTAPWINLYLGGSAISNSDLLRPWASQPAGSFDGSDPGSYFLNIAPGTLINNAGVFVGGETNSEHHIGAGGFHFQSGVTGYLAFAYEGTEGGSTSYGWLRLAPNGGGTGIAFDLAYTDTLGEALTAGAIPEPATYAALAGALALGAVVLRRRRAA